MLPVGFGSRDSVLEDFPLFLFSTEQSLNVTPPPGLQKLPQTPPRASQIPGGDLPQSLGGVVGFGWSRGWMEAGGSRSWDAPADSRGGKGRAWGDPNSASLKHLRPFPTAFPTQQRRLQGFGGGLNPSCPTLHEESLTPELGGLSKPKGIVALVSLGGPLGGSV